MNDDLKLIPMAVEMTRAYYSGRTRREDLTTEQVFETFLDFAERLDVSRTNALVKARKLRRKGGA